MCVYSCSFMFIHPISWCQETVQALKNYGRPAPISATARKVQLLIPCGPVAQWSHRLNLVGSGQKCNTPLVYACMILQKVGSGSSVCMIVWGWKCPCIQPPLQALCEAFEQQTSSGAPSTLAPFKCCVWMYSRTVFNTCFAASSFCFC